MHLYCLLQLPYHLVSVPYFFFYVHLHYSLGSLAFSLKKFLPYFLTDGCASNEFSVFVYLGMSLSHFCFFKDCFAGYRMLG